MNAQLLGWSRGRGKRQGRKCGIDESFCLFMVVTEEQCIVENAIPIRQPSVRWGAAYAGMTFLKGYELRID